MSTKNDGAGPGATPDRDPRGLDRRSLLKAGAWATPVIVLATASPARASTSIPAATGQLSFTNTSYYWRYGTGGVIGLTANMRVQFDPGGTGTVASIPVVIQIENNDNQYLVGGMPELLQGGPAWTVAGPGVSVAVGGESWIQYTFQWTGTLTPGSVTPVLEATVFLTTPLPSVPPPSPWRIVASAPQTDVSPATRSGLGTEVVDPGPPPA